MKNFLFAFFVLATSALAAGPNPQPNIAISGTSTLAGTLTSTGTMTGGTVNPATLLKSGSTVWNSAETQSAIVSASAGAVSTAATDATTKANAAQAAAISSSAASLAGVVTGGTLTNPTITGTGSTFAGQNSTTLGSATDASATGLVFSYGSTTDRGFLGASTLGIWRASTGTTAETANIQGRFEWTPTATPSTNFNTYGAIFGCYPFGANDIGINNWIVGVQASVDNKTTANVYNLTAFDTHVRNSAIGKVVTEANGLRIETPTLLSTARIVNSIGVNIDPQATGTDAGMGIKQSGGTDTNYFAGPTTFNLGVTFNSDVAELHISGRFQVNNGDTAQTFLGANETLIFHRLTIGGFPDTGTPEITGTTAFLKNVTLSGTTILSGTGISGHINGDSLMLAGGAISIGGDGGDTVTIYPNGNAEFSGNVYAAGSDLGFSGRVEGNIIYTGTGSLNLNNQALATLTSGTLGSAAFTSATSYATSSAATNASNLTSGTLATARGGTGVSNAGTITNASNTTITGGGTLALGGFTLTAPATGTTALLGTANAYTQAQTVTKANAVGLIAAYSGDANSYVSFKMGRTGADAEWGVAGGAGQFTTAAVAGDSIFKAVNRAFFIDTNAGSGTPSVAVAANNGPVTIGNGLIVGSAGTNMSTVVTGTSVLVSGTATVANASILATSRIIVGDNGGGVLANMGVIYEDSAVRVSGTMTLKSINILDTSRVTYQIINP